jgi:hypothetical protein
MRVSLVSICLGASVSLGLGLGCAGSHDTKSGVDSDKPVRVPTSMSPETPAKPASSPEDKPEPTAPSPSTDPGAAGAPAMPPGGNAQPTPVKPTGTPEPTAPGKPLAMDECGLNTGYAGDEYCILPPPADKGFQLHVGPSNYDSPEAKYIMQPGTESTDDFRVTSGNDKQIYFYYRQFRMRPGSHHNIVSLTSGGGFGMGRRIGTSNSLAEDSPKGAVIAPENEGVAIAMDANVPINVSLHSNNFGDKPSLREVWINFWYKDPNEVTEKVSQMFQSGDMTFAVQPHQDTVLGPYRCNINGDGRMLWFYGHRHANNQRFSAWRIRGGQRELFYEGLNWEEPIVLEYSSTVMNRVPDRDKGVEGGWSGILDMKAGDVLEWECHVVNKTDGVLRFTNETFTGEMCIMDAELVGANCGAI